MSIITVKSQTELDMIPLDTEDIIRIEFGTSFFPAIVCHKYKYRVEARENSYVEARENSYVEAWENSYVVAWENSYVEAWGNVQVVDYLQGATITLNGNARTVLMPKNIEDFMNFYGIKHDKTTAFFFKAVHKSDSNYIADYDPTFKYTLGQIAKSNGFNSDPDYSCARGIHISHLNWALDYGRNWSDLAILELRVRIKDIVLPNNSDGKVRVPEAKVIREMPLDECGLYGKILLKRRNTEK